MTLTQEQQIALLSDAVTLQTAQVVIAKDATLAQTVAFGATKTRVDTELNNVDNTSDADKPLSTADITALALKVNAADLSTINGLPINTGVPLVIERSRTETETLAYELRGNLRTPIAPLPSAGDGIIVEGIGLLVFVRTTTEPDDDETCFTAVDPVTLLPFGQWLLNIAAPDLLDAWATDERHFRDEYDEDETTRLSLIFKTL